MANVVYAIPMMPRRLNGAREARSLRRHSGSNTVDVIPKRVVDRERFKPAVENRFWNVSAKIILYATFATPVLIVQAQAGIQLVDSPTDKSHASLYVVAPVRAHTRPMREKQYPDSIPMITMRALAG